MLHWTLDRAAAVTPIAALTQPPPPHRDSARSDHARMLAHAAKRRRAAVGEDRGYWMACAPAAVARAAALRHAAGFARLP